MYDDHSYYSASVKERERKENIKELRKRRKAYEAKMERKARELDARMKEDAHELMVMRHAEANHPWDRMDRHDVIDPMANDVIY